MTASISDAIAAIEFASRVVHRIRSCTSIVDRTRQYIDEKLRKLNLPYDKTVLVSEQGKNWRQSSFQLPLHSSSVASPDILSQNIVSGSSGAGTTTCAAEAADTRDDAWQLAFQENTERTLNITNVLFNMGIIEEVQNYKNELEKTFQPIVMSFRRLDIEPSLMLALLKRFSMSSHALPTTHFETTRVQLDQATSLIETQLKKEEQQETRMNGQIAQVLQKTTTYKTRIEKVEVMISNLNTQLEAARARHSKWQKLLVQNSETLAGLQKQLHDISSKRAQSSELHQKQLKIIQLYKSNYDTMLELIHVIKKCQASHEGQQGAVAVDGGLDHSSLSSAQLLPASPTYFSLLAEANPISNIQQAENYVNNDLHLDFDLFSDGFHATASHATTRDGDVFQAETSIANTSHANEMMQLDDPEFIHADAGIGPESWDLSSVLQAHSTSNEHISDTFLAQVDEDNDEDRVERDVSSLAKRPKISECVAVIEDRPVSTDEDEEEEEEQQQQPIPEDADTVKPNKEDCKFANLFYRLRCRKASEVPLEKIVSVREFWNAAPALPKTVLQLLVLHHTTLRTEIINISLRDKSAEQVADQLRLIDERLLQQPSIGLIYVLYQLPSRGSLYTSYNLHQDALLWRIHWNAFDHSTNEQTLQDRFLLPNIHRRMLIAQKFETDPLFLLTVQGIPRDQLPVFTQTHLSATKYASIYAIGFNARFGRDKKTGRHIRRARFNLTLFWRSEASCNVPSDQSVDISTVFFHLPRGSCTEKDSPAYVCETDKRAMLAPLVHFFTLLTREELHGHSLVQFVTLGTAFQNLQPASDDISEEVSAHLEDALSKVEKRSHKALFTLALNRTSQVQMNIFERFYASADYKEHGMMYSGPVDMGLSSSHKATLHISGYCISSILYQERLKKDVAGEGLMTLHQRIEDQRAALVWFACQHDYTQWSSFTWDTAQTYVPGLQIKTSIGKTNIYPAIMADKQYGYLAHRMENQTYQVFSLFRSDWLDHEVQLGHDLVQLCPYFLVYEPVVADFPMGSTTETVESICKPIGVPARQRTLCVDMTRVYAEFNRVVDSQIKMRTSGKLVALPSTTSVANTGTTATSLAETEFVRLALPFVRIHLINTQSPGSLITVSGTVDTRQLTKSKLSGRPARCWLDFLFPNFCLHELGWSGSSILELFEAVLQNACGDISVAVTLQDLAEFNHVDPMTHEHFRMACFYSYAKQYAANYVAGIDENNCEELFQKLFFYARRQYLPVCLDFPTDDFDNHHLNTLRPAMELFAKLINTPASKTWYLLAPSAININESDNIKIWNYLQEQVGARIISSQPHANAAEILFGLMTSDRKFSDYCRSSLSRLPYTESSVFLRLCWSMSTYSRNLPTEKRFFWEKVFPAW